MTQTQPLNMSDLAAMTGLQLMQAVADGSLPPAPIAETLGMTRFEVVEGAVTVYLTADVKHYNPIGSVHGGVISTLLDTAAACSVHSTLGVGEGYTSLDLTVKFLRAVTIESGELKCVGSVIQRGRRTALAQAQLFDEAGKLVAHATSSCMIFS